jgi:hypothetical protein
VETAERLWCASCKSEVSATDAEGRCLWCGEPATPRRRGGWRRPDRQGLFSAEQLRLLHRLHRERGVSIRELGRQSFEQAGYKTAKSAASAISAGWKRLGLIARGRIEQTQRSCTIHGLARRTGSKAAYKRLLRERKGLRPRCKATKRGAPGRGRPCSRPAMHGSEYCVSHDPDRAGRREAQLARMRARIGR